jgi:hypothetical protein
VHLAGEACTLPYEVSIHEFIVWRGQRDANAPANAPARAENFIGMVHPRQAEEIGRELKARQDAGQIEKYVVRSLGQVYQDEAFERALEWISVFGPAVREPDGPPARARDAMAWPPVAWVSTSGGELAREPVATAMEPRPVWRGRTWTSIAEMWSSHFIWKAGKTIMVEIDLSGDKLLKLLSDVDQIYRTLYNGSATGTQGGMVYAVQTTIPALIETRHQEAMKAIGQCARNLDVFVGDANSRRARTMAYVSGASAAAGSMMTGLLWMVLHFDVINKILAALGAGK